MRGACLHEGGDYQVGNFVATQPNTALFDIVFESLKVSSSCQQWVLSSIGLNDDRKETAMASVLFAKFIKFYQILQGSFSRLYQRRF